MTKKPRKNTFLGMSTIKLVFAMEYVMQGLANPFQGITYQPFFKHFTVDYGMTEAQTQGFFSQSYLAWSFKPILGFLIDAYGKTKIILALLLGGSAFFYFLTPIVDVSVNIFFWYMFGLSVILAATDVTVDRATVVEGDAESTATGKSKSTTVGLNQAICWAAIYGTGIFSAVAGGWIADNTPFKWLMVVLGVVPLLVFFIVLNLPKDTNAIIPLKDSVTNFWHGLNTGPVMWIIVFYFIFHFQPAMGALWTNYLIETLKFSQTQIGISDGFSYVGMFAGVLLFAKFGINLQDRWGLRNVFKIVIILSMFVSLTSYIMVEPYFSRVTDVISAMFPFIAKEHVRLGFMSIYNVTLSVFTGFTRMSTFSLVGAVIPSRAAGALFAGFMSVANLAYSFSYSTGAWLYTHGLEFNFVRSLQEKIFGIASQAGNELSISMLILIGTAAYLLSFLATHMLPGEHETRATKEVTKYLIGPDHFKVLGKGFLSFVNYLTFIMMIAMFVVVFWIWGMDPIKSVLISFFFITFLRKILLDWRYNRHPLGASRLRG